MKLSLELSLKVPGQLYNDPYRKFSHKGLYKVEGYII